MYLPVGKGNASLTGYPLRVTLTYYQILFTQVLPTTIYNILAQLRCLEASKIVSTIFPVDGVGFFLKISSVD